MTSRQRTTRARKLTKKTAVIDTSNDELIDLSGIDERHDQLAQLEKQIDSLRQDEHALRAELGLTRTNTVAIDHSALFHDEEADVFEPSPRATHYEALARSLETEDVAFDEAFAVFCAADAEGDHKARRWFDQA